MQPVKLIRRGLMALAFGTMLVCVILLLNFTASNPTGRRYSSDILRSLNPQTRGLEGERILANDLDLPRNDQAGQGQCICRSASDTTAPKCKSCLIVLPSVSTYRIPDFVGKDFIADAKTGPAPKPDAQIRDFVMAAEQLDMPLWIYVEADALIGSSYRDMVESTGGGIVYYFAKPGYKDVTDRNAEAGLAGGAMVLSGGLFWEIRSRRKPRPDPVPPEPLPMPPVSAASAIRSGTDPDQDGSPVQVVRSRSRPQQPGRAIDDAESFLHDTRERARRKLDDED